MNPDELALILIFVTILLGLAGYFGWRQVQTLRKLAAEPPGDAEDRRYLRTQAYRRLFCSGLMAVFAGLLIGWIFLDQRYRNIQAQVPQGAAALPEGQLTEEQKDFVRLFSVYWIVALLILLVLVALAAVDFWAIARYGLSQRRRLQEDHRALLAEQVAARRKQQRNGQH